MIWTVLAGLLSGALGAMGLGGGGVLVIYLTLVAQMEQTTAQGVNLLLFIPCALLALIPYCRKKLICWKIALPAILFGLVGAFAGVWLSGMLDPSLLRKLFGGMLLLIGLRELFSRPKPKKSS